MFLELKRVDFISNILVVKTIKTQVLSPRKGLYLIFYNATLRVFLLYERKLRKCP